MRSSITISVLFMFFFSLPGIAQKNASEAPVSQKSNYSLPQNIMPVNEKIFSEAEIKKPLTFKWMAITPKPENGVVYKLRVWQLMQGQNSEQAMKMNMPVAEKEIEGLTQAVLANIITGPCKPPYLCDFIWSVEAAVKDRAGDTKIIGTSTPGRFSAVQAAHDRTKKDSVTVKPTSTPTGTGLTGG